MAALRCEECGAKILELDDEQEARRAADPEAFAMTCFLCTDWHGELEAGDIELP